MVAGYTIRCFQKPSTIEDHWYPRLGYLNAKEFAVFTHTIDWDLYVVWDIMQAVAGLVLNFTWSL